MSDASSKLQPGQGLTSADWAGENARHWAAVADHVEAQLEPVADLLLERAELARGERVLDVGCGRGVTTRRAAHAVAPDGVATGLDISPALLDEARALTPPDLPVEWIVADAQRHAFPREHYDAVISRFGVMFFDDAVAACTNLRRAVRPGGRMCVVVWQVRDRSEIMQLPLDLAVRAAARRGVDLDVGSPHAGAFTWGDAAAVEAMLDSAGWRDVHIDPHVLAMYTLGPGSVERIVDSSLSMGGLRRALADHTPELVDAVRAELLVDFTERHDGTGVELEGAVAVVTARA
jgi:SAM-dependent methyltransferase